MGKRSALYDGQHEHCGQFCLTKGWGQGWEAGSLSKGFSLKTQDLHLSPKNPCKKQGKAVLHVPEIPALGKEDPRGLLASQSSQSEHQKQ